jgi:hypothetical protein
MGFVDLPSRDTPYARADVFMERGSVAETPTQPSPWLAHSLKFNLR